MTTWREIADEFRALEIVLKRSTLDRTWDDAGQLNDWSLSGSGDFASEQRFRAVARIAGRLLEGDQNLVDYYGPLVELDPVVTWFRAMWEYGGPHPPPLSGTVSQNGVETGRVFHGRIPEPAAVAATLGLRFHAESEVAVPHVLPPPPPKSRYRRFRDWVRRQRREHGEVWSVVGWILPFIVAILGLILVM